MDERALRIKELRDSILEKQHAKDLNRFYYAKLKVYAPDESDLHEITLTCIKTLDHNGAWDIETEHIERENANIILFKWNGGVLLLDAFEKQPRFSCEHRMSLVLDADRDFDF
ncbi:hypothetical protein [uncultured Ruminococcus sp.]|uniref:hypothetical protein n=1 Tax=uncultured Ruminococcus sp. TaxID=165186 RepID=UPI0025F67C53|nr:hypothetical protein [uncultured Ruminococcus sp.]